MAQGPAKREKVGLQLADFLAPDVATLAERMLEPATLQAAYRASAAMLAGQRDPTSLTALAEQAAELAEGLWAELAAESPAAACRKGCAWCCHQNVTVTVPEAVRVLDHVRARLAPAEIDALRQHVARRAAEIRGLTTADRFDRRLACAFLADGICTIHPARPLQCRGGFSQDEGFCRDLLRDRAAMELAVAEDRATEPFLTVPKTLFNSAQTGLAAALQQARMEGGALELTAAMAVLLEDPGAAERWARGEPVAAATRLHRTARGHAVADAEE